MSVIQTESIWSLKNGVLIPREGNVVLDNSYPITEEKDLLGPIPVEAGLQKSDTLVFLGYIGLENEAAVAGSTPYLVTRVDNHDSGGILVASELVMRDPRGWINNRILGMWQTLHKQGFTLENLGWPELDEYIVSVPPQPPRKSAHMQI